MTYSQPQQQQPQYRPNRTALWVNSRKSAANQPDYKGNIEITYALLQELQGAFNAGQYQQDAGGQPCIKLDLALYAQQGGVSATGKAKPILSGQLSTLAQTMESAAARQQAAQQYAPQQPQHAPPSQPAYHPQSFQPLHAPAPAPAAPVPAQFAPAPAPMPQQQQPAYQQPPQPQAPAVAPPVGQPQPMPGAIHGQSVPPPAAPAGLPANF